MIPCPALGTSISTERCESDQGVVLGCPASCPRYVWGFSRADDVMEICGSFTNKLLAAVSPWFERLSQARRRRLYDEVYAGVNPSDISDPETTISINFWLSLRFCLHPDYAAAGLLDRIKATCTKEEMVLADSLPKVEMRLLEITGEEGDFSLFKDLLSGETGRIVRDTDSELNPGEALFGGFYTLPHFSISIGPSMVLPSGQVPVLLAMLRKEAGEKPLPLFVWDRFAFVMGFLKREGLESLAAADVKDCTAYYRLNVPFPEFLSRMLKFPMIFLPSEDDVIITQEEPPAIAGWRAPLPQDEETGRYIVGVLAAAKGGFHLTSGSQATFDLAKRKLEEAFGDLLSPEVERVIDTAAQTAAKAKAQAEMDVPDMLEMIRRRAASLPASERQEFLLGARNVLSDIYAKLPSAVLPGLGATLAESVTKDPDGVLLCLVYHASGVTKIFDAAEAHRMLDPVMDQCAIPDSMRVEVWHRASLP